MATKRVDENPCSGDTILFDIFTSDSDGCLVDPYKIDKIVIYFVERNFAAGNFKTYQKTILNKSTDDAAKSAEQEACDNPTTDNIEQAIRLRTVANASSSSTNMYFTSTNPVSVEGSADYPAWLSTDIDNSRVYHELKTFGDGLDGNPITIDPSTGNEEPIPGHFLYQWDSQGSAREGDYFICWTWTPNPAGDSFSAHIPFYIQGKTELTQSIPTHFTVPDKYEILLDRYLDEMFKMMIAPSDLTPDVLNRLNKSIAMGFTTVENLANQIIDLLDANSCHEVLIPYLANLFNLKLKSGDPTLWRRQIKRAIPLYKKKGTLGGLQEAMAQAGMSLNKFTKLYQVTSKYTWVDFFTYDGSDFVTTFDPIEFTPVSNVNFYLSIRLLGESNWTSYPISQLLWDYDEDGNLVLSIDHEFINGDQILVRYQMATIPNSTEQTLETYVRSLLLADQREENIDGTVIYPLKNWNVRVIEEDDPLFKLICNFTDEYQDNVIFGHIRTEFPYSENIWNMDEYNGSTRESNLPCDIDKNYLDACTCCLSSKFNIDVEIENLNNDKIQECQEIVHEFVPFHAVPHMFNLSSRLSDFIKSPIESLRVLIKYHTKDNILAGNANPYFNRFRGMGYDTPTRPFEPIDNNPFNPSDYEENGTLDPSFLIDVRRNMLATSQVVLASSTGIAYNSGVFLFCPEIHFDRIGVSPNNLLEVFSPSSNHGSYVVSSPEKNVVKVLSVTEPVDTAQFTFRLSNFIYQNGGGSIFQDDIFSFSDPDRVSLFSQASSLDYINLTGYGSYQIIDVNSDGTLNLSDPSRTLPTSMTSGIAYTLMGVNGTGTLNVKRRGRVESNDPYQPEIRHHIELGDYALLGGTQYKISGFDSSQDNSFYLDEYNSGDAGGIFFQVYRRLLNNQIGNFDYRGINLDCLSDQESGLLIQDGSGLSINPSLWVESTIPGQPAFRGNFIVTIGDDYYLISNINHNIIALSGPMNSWGTLENGGTPVLFSISQFSNVTTNLSGVGETLNVDGHEYEFIDRRGNDTVHRVITTVSTSPTPLVAMTAATLNNPSDQPRDVVLQKERTGYTINYINGDVQSGEI